MATIIPLLYTNNRIEYNPNILSSLEHIVKLHNSCFGDQITVNHLESVSVMTDIYVLYTKKRTYVPIAMFFLEKKTKYVSFMADFCVDKPYRRQGIGTKLFDFMRYLGKRGNIDYILFDSYKTEPENTEFYNKIGCVLLSNTKPNSNIWSAY